MIEVVKCYKGVVELDIWGIIDKEYEKEFRETLANCTNITYRGVYSIGEAQKF